MQQIVSLLRQIEVAVPNGKTTSQASKEPFKEFDYSSHMGTWKAINTELLYRGSCIFNERFGDYAPFETVSRGLDILDKKSAVIRS